MLLKIKLHPLSIALLKDKVNGKYITVINFKIFVFSNVHP